MNKTTLEQWRMFRAVVEAGGFSQASDVVHKSQSSIHYAVHKLEETLGIKLLEVVGRKAVLTDIGATMLRRADYLLKEAQKLEKVATTLSNGAETMLRIAVDEAFPQHYLCEALQRVSQAYPMLRIELLETVLTGAVELLAEQKVQLAISPVAKSDVQCEELCRIDFIAVAAPHHPLLQHDGKISFEELKSHRQIVVRDSALTTNRDSGWLGSHQRWTVSHIRTSIDMICRGLGFAWLPASEVETYLQEGRLARLPLQEGTVRSAALHILVGDIDQLGPAGHMLSDELRNVSKNSKIIA
jgi:DNA-binding transcriptional LysR family regulator